MSREKEKFRLTADEPPDRLACQQASDDKLAGVLTEYKRTARELSYQKKWLEALFKNATDAIIIFDRDHCIVEINQKFFELFGYTLAEIKGKNIDDVIDTGKQGTADRAYTRAVLSGQSIVGESTRFDKEGRPVEALIKGIPIVIDGILTGGYAIYSDITQRKRAEEALQYQLAFEKMVADISATFVNVPADKLNEAIDRALRLSGEFFKVDRSYIFKFSDDGKVMGNTHEWCAEGVEPQIVRLKNIPVDRLPWWMEQVRSREHVYIPDVNALPPEAEAEKKEFQLEKIRSLLTIWMTRDGSITGFFGFDSVREKKTWTEEQISLLKVIAEIISSALLKHQAEEALKDSEEKYREILSSIEDGYYEVDLAGTVTFCNDSAARMLGYAVTEFIGMNYQRFCKDHAAVFRAFNQVFRSGQSEITLTIEMVCKDSSASFGELSLSLTRDQNGNVIGFRGVGRNVSERHRFEEQLKYLSLHDQLTGLYNRTYFEDELMRLNGSREYPVSIISADLDGLKLINDSLGHNRGDELLKACAAVLNQSLRSSDILARVGGDEFVAILPETNAEAGKEIVNRILSRVACCNREQAGLPLSISIGLSTAEKEGLSVEEAYKEADDLMYRDKLHKGVAARSQVINALMAALGERDFITEGHAQRLEELCRKVGGRANLTSKQLSNLALLSRVHDLGKVGIPDNILLKQGPLTEKEWEIMRQHPEKGYRIALVSTDLSGVADLILKHHERWDGSGYPLGLAGEEIPVECRILSIVDAYDAMIYGRPYSKVRNIADAVAELQKCAGSQFDPAIIKIFLPMIDPSYS